ncbi:hypothetical protein ACOJR9_06875 [Alteromonas sp. A081]|uniref:hypothetical protein n=1 Tax=Alteromonas sp. A081 TaxID=3410269 RepID=UPI003B980F49
MDISSVNSAPVSTILESTPQVPRRQEQRSEETNQVSESRPSNETSSNSSDSRLGSRVDVFA